MGCVLTFDYPNGHAFTAEEIYKHLVGAYGRATPKNTVECEFTNIFTEKSAVDNAVNKFKDNFPFSQVEAVRHDDDKQRTCIEFIRLI